MYTCMNVVFPAEAGFNNSVLKAMVGVVIQFISVVNQFDQA